jgi:hypothetical protein
MDRAIFVFAAEALAIFMAIACFVSAKGFQISAARLRSPNWSYMEAIALRNSRNRDCFTDEGWEKMRLARRGFWQGMFFAACAVVLHTIALGLHLH